MSLREEALTIGAVIFLTSFFDASSAQADFAYTKWGMSPAEVIVASRGEASLAANPERTPGGAVEAITGTFASGLRRFSSRFDFVDGKLSMVLLTQTQGDCATLRTELLQTYGVPAKDPGILMMLEWNDPRKGNVVEYIYVDGQCKISYKPLIGYSPNKL